MNRMFLLFEFFEETWDVEEHEEEDDGDTDCRVFAWLGLEPEVRTLMKAEFLERLCAAGSEAACGGGGALIRAYREKI